MTPDYDALCSALGKLADRLLIRGDYAAPGQEPSYSDVADATACTQAAGAIRELVGQDEVHWRTRRSLLAEVEQLRGALKTSPCARPGRQEETDGFGYVTVGDCVGSGNCGCDCAAAIEREQASSS